MTELPSVVAGWFAAKGWAPRRHQLEMLAAAEAGRSALLVAPTGAGKTLAGFLPSIVALAEAPTEGLHTLYISRSRRSPSTCSAISSPRSAKWSCRSGSRPAPATPPPTARRGSGRGRRRYC